MIINIIAILILISVLLALWSFERQKKLSEVKEVRKELQQGKVIYDSSSSKLSDLV
jgi:hypothetical protein